MATYTIQAPDGHTLTMEGPDGASHDDVISQAQKLYTPDSRVGSGAPPAPKPPTPAGLVGPPVTPTNTSWLPPSHPDPTPGFGPSLMGEGLRDIVTPGSRMAGVHKALIGAGETVAPMFVPTSIPELASTVGAVGVGGVGSAVGKYGSRALGASPEASDLIGDATGGAAAFGGGRLGRAVGDAGSAMMDKLAPIQINDPAGIRQPLPNPKGEEAKSKLIKSIPVVGRFLDEARRFSSPSTPEPYRPNPGVVGTPFSSGGAEAPFKGPAYPAARPEYTPPPSGPVLAPVRPNPAIAAKMRFGGSPDLYSGPSYPSPTITPTLAPVPGEGPSAPAYQGPNRVNPNIARNLRFTPADNPNAGGVTQPTLGTRAAMMDAQRLKAKALQGAPFFDPRESQVVAPPDVDTLASQRARVQARAAKFDENGKRNQLNSK